jgi:sulfofructose kinase
MRASGARESAGNCRCIYTYRMNQTPQVDLVGVGLNATDTLIAIPSFPERGSKMEYRSVSILPGGQVATTVVACQRWGLSTRYVGILGEDAAATLHRESFEREGVESHLTTVPGGSSPQSLILVDGGERTILFRRDERVALKPAHLKRTWVTRARALHVDGYDTEAAIQAALWAREAGIPVVADLDDIYPGVENLLENVDYLIVSRDIPLRLTGESDLELALRQMHHRFRCRLTAATLGHEGALAWDGQQIYDAPAYIVPVADTTGAGDIFHAGFIYGLLRQWPLQQQLNFGAAAAAMNCMSAGARGGIAAPSEIEAFMATCDRRKPAYVTSRPRLQALTARPTA